MHEINDVDIYFESLEIEIFTMFISKKNLEYDFPVNCPWCDIARSECWCHL